MRKIILFLCLTILACATYGCADDRANDNIELENYNTVCNFCEFRDSFDDFQKCLKEISLCNSRTAMSNTYEYLKSSCTQLKFKKSKLPYENGMLASFDEFITDCENECDRLFSFLTSETGEKEIMVNGTKRSLYIAQKLGTALNSFPATVEEIKSFFSYKNYEKAAKGEKAPSVFWVDKLLFEHGYDGFRKVAKEKRQITPDIKKAENCISTQYKDLYPYMRTKSIRISDEEYVLGYNQNTYVLSDISGGIFSLSTGLYEYKNVYTAEKCKEKAENFLVENKFKDYIFKQMHDFMGIYYFEYRDPDGANITVGIDKECCDIKFFDQ